MQTSSGDCGTVSPGVYLLIFGRGILAGTGSGTFEGGIGGGGGGGSGRDGGVKSFFRTTFSFRAPFVVWGVEGIDRF